MSATALLPEGWLAPVGYANGHVTEGPGRLVVLAGQIGWNPAIGAVETDDFAAQVGVALANIAALLRAAGADASHLVRLTWFITDRDAYLAARRKIGALYRDALGRHYPPMSVVVVSALIEARAKVEIEATAWVPE